MRAAIIRRRSQSLTKRPHRNGKSSPRMASGSRSSNQVSASQSTGRVYEAFFFRALTEFRSFLEKSGGRPTTFQNKKTGNPFTRNGKPAGKFTKSGDKGAAGANGAVPEVKPEKVDWTKFKQDKKDLKLKRKAAKAGFDKIQEAKQIYEKLKW